MEQSPSWEANIPSVSQEIPCFLEFECSLSSSQQPLVPKHWQMNPVHTLIYYFFKIHLNIILQTMAGPPEWSLPFRFSN